MQSNTRALRYLLYLELAVCYVPVCLELALGLLVLPTWLSIVGAFLFGYPPNASFWDGIAQSLLSILLVVGGVIGLSGVWQTIQLLRRGHAASRGHSYRYLALAIGALALIGFNMVTDGFSLDGDAQSALSLLFTLVLPLACTAHIMFLSRTINRTARVSRDIV